MARIDLYEIDGDVIFGEITFFQSGGMAIIKPEEQDYIFGDMIDLSDLN